MALPVVPRDPNLPMSPDALLDVAETVEGAEADMVATAAPEPATPYKKRTLVYLADTLNKLAAANPGMARVSWTFQPSPEGRDEMTTPLPRELWNPLVALSAAIAAVNTDGAFDEYLFDPASALDDASLRVIVDTIATAMKDKKLMDALEAGPSAEEPSAEVSEGGPAPETPAAMSVEDYAGRM